MVAQGAQFMFVSCDYDMGAPAATMANEHNMISISPCASDAKMGVQGIGPYAFTLNTYGQGEGAGMAKFAYRDLGKSKAYLLLDASIEYGKSICHGFLEQWKDFGLEVIGVDSYMQEDASIASQITRYKQLAADRGEPDFLYICSYDVGAVSAIRQIRGAGIDVAIGGGDSMDGDYWVEGIPGLSDHYQASFGSIWGDDPRPEVNAVLDASGMLGEGLTADALNSQALKRGNSGDLALVDGNPAIATARPDDQIGDLLGPPVNQFAFARAVLEIEPTGRGAPFVDAAEVCAQMLTAQEVEQNRRPLCPDEGVAHGIVRAPNLHVARIERVAGC